MPGSTVSINTIGSSSSAGRRARTKQYRKVGQDSQVDETLFGTPNHVQQRNDMLEDKRRHSAGPEVLAEQAAARRQAAGKGRRSAKSSKETVQVITKDLIRNLVVPGEDPSGHSCILSYDDYVRIKNAARVLSEDDKQQIAEMRKRETEEKQNAAEDRKQFMKEKDLTRRRNEPLNDLEEEAKERAETLLSKANEMRQEQEDEIKHLNEMILNAKCHAIRDAQMLEKSQMSKELQDEERRLDTMMEVDRQNALRIQEEIEKRRKEEQFMGAAKVLEQIAENEQERLFDLERKDQENVQMQKYLERLMEEDIKKLEKKRVNQLQHREELNKANEDILKRKALKLEQEKLADAKVLEFQRAKAEREQAYELEQQRIKIEKEKEVARLRGQQERARDEQAERDALRAKRAQEQSEREWRKKEAEEMRKKAETEAMLKDARAFQMEQKEHFLAVQAQRERAEFERVLKAQKELIEKDKRKEGESKSKRLTHADDVRKQIREKEQERIMARNTFFEEGVKLDEEARERRQKLDRIKSRKLEELRSMGLADKYVREVARKAQVPLQA